MKERSFQSWSVSTWVRLAENFSLWPPAANRHERLQFFA
jgi:hypothetical protein